MPLDSTNSFGTVRIDTKKWGATVRDFIAAKALKKLKSAEADAADRQYKALRGQLFPALSGAPAAMCGNHLLTVKRGSAAAASLTLANGRKVAWSVVQAVRIGGKLMPAAEIASVYGGRAASEDIEVTGA